MTKYADLHIHTTASDGDYSPEAVVRAAKAQGFSALAITDHDTLSGLAEAQKISKEIGIELLTGVEISTVHQEKEVHILGYLIDPTNEYLQEKLNLMNNYRQERIAKMVKRLNDLGYEISLNRVYEISGQGAIGRPHVAKALWEKGYIKNIKEAFLKLLSPGCPAYIPRFKITPEEAIELITTAGGIPVLAHPGINLDDDLIPYLKNTGLMGLEVWHPEHSSQMVEKYYKIATQLDLLMTGGSDWHGNNKDASFSLGVIKVDYYHVEKLKLKHIEIRR